MRQSGKPGAAAVLAVTALAPGVPVGTVAAQVGVPHAERVSFSAGADLVTQYVARGIVYSDKPSLQPWIEGNAPLTEPREDSAYAVSLRFGSWNSVQASTTDAGRPLGIRERRLRHWYEADLYTGFVVALSERLSATATYFLYTSPSGAFSTSHEAELRLGFDDGGLWPADAGAFSLNPALRFTQEIHNENVSERWYLQPSLTPSYTFAASGVTVQLPLVMGFGGSGWYRDGDGRDLTRGFFQTGLRFSAPLPTASVPLTLSGGVDAVFAADRAISGTGNRTEVVGRLGLSAGF